MTRRLRVAIAILLPAVAFAFLYRHVLVKLVSDWATDDNYSHGFLIVPIALYFVWERREKLRQAVPRPSVLGLLLVLASVAVLVAGLLGAELFLTRISMLGVLAGAILFMLGWAHLAILLFPLAFLLLMIPIPAIIFNQIAFPLQLLASRFGEFALTLAGIPMLREGNVITLANTSLEVAEACSGIRSLISLITLALVYGYLADSRIWARTALTLAAIPVAIVANGIRVAGTGIAAHHLGAEAAMGFFHTFSGWLVFIVAFLLLFLIQRAIVLIAPVKTVGGRQLATPKLSAPLAHSEGGSTVAGQSGVSHESAVDSRQPARRAPHLLVRALAVGLCLVAGAVVVAGTSRAEVVPARESFATFPLQVGPWRGEPAPRFDQQVLTVLGVDEYVSRTYFKPDGLPVGLYIGYYGSQRQGDTMHSPLNCMPGAGWEPVRKDRPMIDVTTAAGPRAIQVNRLVILKGLEKQVVVYWYQSHDRVVASEYWGKIYTVVDAIRLNRTDAAMIRLISPVVGAGPDAEAAAERRVVELTQAVFPLLGRYLPD